MRFLIAGNLLFIYFSFMTAYVFKFGHLEFKTALADALITSVITLIGINACYTIYKDGANFIQAFIVLSVPALIYSTIFFWTAYWGFLYVLENYSQDRTFQTLIEADAFISQLSVIKEMGVMTIFAMTTLSFFAVVGAGLKIANNSRAR